MMYQRLTQTQSIRHTRPVNQIVLWLCGFLFAFFTCWSSAHAAVIQVTQASLEHTDNSYRIQTAYQFSLNNQLRDVLNHGVPLYFTEELRITKSRWYWFDKSVVHQQRTTRISYNILTNQYHISTDGQLQRAIGSLEEALATISRPARWSIEDESLFDVGTTYTASVKLELDVSKLPKPFQVNALNDSDWRVSSPWQTFTFTPE